MPAYPHDFPEGKHAAEGSGRTRRDSWGCSVVKQVQGPCDLLAALITHHQKYSSPRYGLFTKETKKHMVNQDKTQERQKKLLEKWEEADNLECDAGLLLLTKSAAGRKYLWRLLQWGRVGTQPFTADSHVTAFGCGELNVGQQILAHLIEVDPAGYLSILKERTDEQRSRDTDYARVTDPSYNPAVNSGGNDDADNSGDADGPDEPASYP